MLPICNYYDIHPRGRCFMRKSILTALIILICLPVLAACNINPYLKMPPEQLAITNRQYNVVLPVFDGWIAVGRLHGDQHDAVIAKYDKVKNIVWQRAFGGSDIDEFNSVIEIDDGYIVLADCYSVDGDLTGINTKKSSVKGIIVKYSKDGNKIWAKKLDANIAVANEAGFVAAYNYDANCNILTQFNPD